MLIQDQGFEAGSLVAVKRNDDLASYFRLPNFTVFRPRMGAALFYTREAIPTYVELLGKPTAEQLASVEEKWPSVRRGIKQKWKDNDAS